MLAAMGAGAIRDVAAACAGSISTSLMALTCLAAGLTSPFHIFRHSTSFSFSIANTSSPNRRKNAQILNHRDQPANQVYIVAMEKATFGAGCFWGVEAAFRLQNGVIETTVGYAGGHTDHPTYEQVCAGGTGHVEALQITFDPKVISYERLLDIFWQIHDPTLADRQGNDVGTQYQAVIFYHSEAQRQAAERSKENLEKSGQYDEPIVTKVEPAGQFWAAEVEHQRYLEKHPGGYCHINLSAIK